MYFDEFKHQLPDIDPAETDDWLASLDQVVADEGEARARFIIYKLLKRARQLQVGLPPLTQTRYINTISPEQEPVFPGDEAMERRIRRLDPLERGGDGPAGQQPVRRASAATSPRTPRRRRSTRSASTTSSGARTATAAATRSSTRATPRPGIYARAFLEGRLSDGPARPLPARDRARRAAVSSYPHPRLMPEFWEFPTVSMGLGPISAIYQARYNRYLHNRGLLDTSDSRVWAFLGDGETDEPESLGALHVASREGLDNLTFVVNCNLQRLDGPVRGNGKIIQELESAFRGAGWNVIKVIWGREWDELLARDVDGLLVQQMNETLDGEFQKFSVAGGAYIREHFFGPDPRLHEARRAPVRRRPRQAPPRRPRLPQGLRRLQGRDRAHRRPDRDPGPHGQGLDARAGRRGAQHHPPGQEAQRGRAPRSSATASSCRSRTRRSRTRPYYHPGADSRGGRSTCVERRRALGGPLPRRVVRAEPLPAPAAAVDAEFAAGSPTPVSTTMVFARILRNLIRDPELGPRIVPIIPDEARTFGMDPLFKEVGIYSALGQRYSPVDSDLVLSYREATDGQVLEEGITEAGSMASLQAAGTSYATTACRSIPFYIFYSMFGFQRTGDQMWAFGDARGRGFLMGATAGRTTLTGEGLQHDDGTAQILASTVPNIRAYDPAFAYELAAVVRDGIERMYGPKPEDVFYYVTIYNENYAQPPRPDGLTDEAILRGVYRFADAPDLGRDAHPARLVGPGAILQQVLAAREPPGRAVRRGRRDLPPSVVMNVVPAQVAGVASLAVSSPPQREPDCRTRWYSRRAPCWTSTRCTPWAGRRRSPCSGTAPGERPVSPCRWVTSARRSTW